MGFKAACIFVSEKEPGFLGTLPNHCREDVEPTLERLGLRLKRRLGPVDLSDGIFPDDGQTVIGCFTGTLFIADQKRVSAAVEFPEKCSLLRSILQTYPRATIMVMSLHSVSNYFGYALYEGGKRIRAHSGVSDEPNVDWEEGAPLPEELPHYSRSHVRDGQRFFLTDVAGKTEEVDSASYGETLTFAVAGRFLGKPFDCFLDRLAVETVQLQSPKQWWQFW